MSIFAWIALGAIAGWIASMLAGTNAQMGLLANIVVGIVGAFLGGLIFSLFGGEGVTGFNIWSLLVAVVGAFVLLLILKSFHRTA
ncbi:MAG TPA: GlsB/YeaQ/YmgE family stress response membrane protein [Patescibacteria group bacterium]|nr:GlsB/YeaQ/YmgE family stress response membrane protein [Patescibacteria group bacterium]